MKSDDPRLIAVRSANEQVAQATRTLEDTVQAARAAGATWQLIGSAIGVTKQAAAQRFSESVYNARSLSQIQVELEQITEALFAALAHEDIEHVHSHMTYTTARLLSKRKILKTWEQVTGTLGAFIEVKKTVVEQSGSGFVLTYRLRHEKGEPVGQISFNAARKVTGLVIFNDDSAELPW